MEVPVELVVGNHYRIKGPVRDKVILLHEDAKYIGFDNGYNKFMIDKGVISIRPNAVGYEFEALESQAEPMEVDGGKRRKQRKQRTRRTLRKTHRRARHSTRRRK